MKDNLGLVDPGYPVWKAETLKDLGTCEMNLARSVLGAKQRPFMDYCVRNSVIKVCLLSAYRSSEHLLMNM